MGEWRDVEGLPGGLDAAVAAVIGGEEGGPSPPDPLARLPGEGEKRWSPHSRERGEGEKRRSPHSRERAGRQMSVSFPSAAWPDAVRGLAERWGWRPGDVLVYAVAHLMAAVEDGMGRPGGEVRDWQRSGEGGRPRRVGP